MALRCEFLCGDVSRCECCTTGLAQHAAASTHRFGSDVSHTQTLDWELSPVCGAWKLETASQVTARCV